MTYPKRSTCWQTQHVITSCRKQKPSTHRPVNWAKFCKSQSYSFLQWLPSAKCAKCTKCSSNCISAAHVIRIWISRKLLNGFFMTQCHHMKIAHENQATIFRMTFTVLIFCFIRLVYFVPISSEIHSGE